MHLTPACVEAYWAEVGRINAAAGFEKVAAKPSTLAALVGAITAAGASYMLDRGNIRQDRMLRSMGHMSEDEYQQATARRRLKALGIAGLTAGLAGFGVPAARKEMVRQSQKFVEQTIRPAAQKTIDSAISEGDAMLKRQADYAIQGARSAGREDLPNLGGAFGTRMGETFAEKLRTEVPGAAGAAYETVRARAVGDMAGAQSLGNAIAEQIIAKLKAEAPGFGEEVAKGMKAEMKSSLPSMPRFPFGGGGA